MAVNCRGYINVWTRRDPLLAIFAAIFLPDSSRSAAGAALPTRSEIKSHFRFARRIIGQALRDLAVQANCNISYEPVDGRPGFKAPPISGEFTVGRVLSLLLKGTKLRAIDINETRFKSKRSRSIRRKTQPPPGTGTT